MYKTKSIMSEISNNLNYWDVEMKKKQLEQDLDKNALLVSQLKNKRLLVTKYFLWKHALKL